MCRSTRSSGTRGSPLTLEVLALVCALFGSPARADEGAAAPEAAEEDPLSPYRTPFGVLVERTIGTTSKPVEFNWRRTKVQVAGTGDFLFELNNFNSLRAGGLVRWPASGLLYELGLSQVWVWDTYSSELLALTPYRQPGRPNRLEIDFNVGIPLAEGVVTTRTRFVPSVEMVLNAYAGLRYSLYTKGFGGMRVGEVATALISPALTEDEIENLDDERLDAMQVDPGRYGLMLGLGNDLYFKQGVFLNPRVMFSLPALAVASGSELLVWGNFSLAVGVAF